MNAYMFKTELCTWVVRQAREPDKWELCWYLPDGNWERSGYYIDPKLAASDVYRQETGFSDWDMKDSSTIPVEIEGINNWERVRNYP